MKPLLLTNDIREYLHRIYTDLEEEKGRLGVEIHDEMGALFTDLKIHILSYSRNPTSEELDYIIENIDLGIDTIKKIAYDLKPVSITDIDNISNLLRKTIRRYMNIEEIHITYQSEPNEIDLGKELNLVAFRISQELLTNVMRHAQADHIRILTRLNRSAFELTIEDNGIGIEPHHITSEKSFGLRCIHERLIPYRGEFDIRPCNPKGTSTYVKIPINQRVCE